MKIYLYEIFFFSLLWIVYFLYGFFFFFPFFFIYFLRERRSLGPVKLDVYPSSVLYARQDWKALRTFSNFFPLLFVVVALEKVQSAFEKENFCFLKIVEFICKRRACFSARRDLFNRVWKKRAAGGLGWRGKRKNVLYYNISTLTNKKNFNLNALEKWVNSSYILRRSGLLFLGGSVFFCGSLNDVLVMLLESIRSFLSHLEKGIFSANSNTKPNGPFRA